MHNECGTIETLVEEPRELDRARGIEEAGALGKRVVRRMDFCRVLKNRLYRVRRQRWICLEHQRHRA